MTSLPDHVRDAVAPPPRKPASRKTSPYRPWVHKYYRLPWGEWVLLYGPSAALLGLVVLDNNAAALFLVALVNVALLVPAFYRIPQEHYRAKARRWTRDTSTDAYAWHDPSGEWDYARWQSTSGSALLRWVVVLPMPLCWGYAVYQSSESGDFLPWLVLMVAIGVLAYLHRHLPTSLRPARVFRVCEACGNERHGHAHRICPRCGRVTEIVVFPALPALRRRWRDL